MSFGQTHSFLLGNTFLRPRQKTPGPSGPGVCNLAFTAAFSYAFFLCGFRLIKYMISNDDMVGAYGGACVPEMRVGTDIGIAVDGFLGCLYAA